MKVIRYQGFYTKGTSTAYGSNIITLQGSNSNESYSSYVSINYETISEINDENGLLIVVINPDLTLNRQKFFKIKKEQESKSAMRFINSINNSNTKYLICIVSSGNLEQDNSSILKNTFKNIGSVLWNKKESNNKIIDNKFVKNEIPYCCVMSNDLGIVYEKYGNYIVNDEDDNALLNVPYHDFHSFGLNGYGINLVNKEDYKSKSKNSTNYEIPISNIDISQNIRIQFEGYIENLHEYPNKNANVYINEDGNNIKSFKIDSNIWESIDYILYMNNNKNYKLIIDKDSDISITIKNISVVKCGKSLIDTNTKFKFNKNSENLSCFDIYECYGNFYYENENDYKNAFNQGIKPFVMDEETFLYKDKKQSINILSSMISDYIEIDPNIDYSFTTWFHGEMDNDEIKIKTYFYDSNKNPINAEYFDGNFSQSILIDNYKIDNNEYGFSQSFLLSRKSTRFDLHRFNKIDNYPIYEGGTGLKQLYKNTPKFNDNIKYIKLEIKAYKINMIMPFISEIKFGFKNNGTLLGPLIESSWV
ncbi:hypothetical protein PBI_SCTP2_137 [Salicola phage SCTP-2]|nr:hypothetical protein PBI_SCTP2_137 [Salicola phage SCTP-2]